jgi:hypothetical protein
MKTLGDAETKREILARLQLVGPESGRRWGRMTAPQMICHLADSFRGVMGERTLSKAPSFLPRKFVKWVALDLPIQWPHGTKTMPEVDQEAGGTPPKEFASDVEELKVLMQRFSASERDFKWSPHPFFGSMTEGEWMRWGYRHMDHHLRQFGV